jgi:hypothetical protein
MEGDRPDLHRRPPRRATIRGSANIVKEKARMPEQQWGSANFSFLAVYDAQLVRLRALAERYFKEDPATSLIKLRQ